MPRYLLLCLLFALACQPASPPPLSSSLASQFANPPASARPKALWDWVNGNFSLSQITYELEEARDKGMGGLDIWDVGILVDPENVVPAGPPFLSDPSLQAIAHTVREAERLGLEIGLINSSSWNAGGSWVEAEHGAMGLFRSQVEVSGPQTFTGALPFPDIPKRYGNRHDNILEFDPETGLPVFFREVAVIALPSGPDSLVQAPIELSSQFANGQLHWKVPAGEWTVSRYVCTNTGQPLMIPSPHSRGRMLDHFSAEAQRANLAYIFDRLLTVFDSLNDRALKYLYVDSYEVNTAIWTPKLPEEFAARCGYRLEPYLPALDGYTVKNEETTARFLFDFRKTLSDLIIENHYRLGVELCGEYGLGFQAEAGGPGPPIHNVPFEDLKALGSLTVPRGEFWNTHPKQEQLQIVKGIASAAHLYDQTFVEAEAFTSVWLWQEGPAELKPLADRAMAEGLNRFVYHTFPHIPPEAGHPGWVYNFGTLINPTRAWWEKSGPFHEYLARHCFLLQQGNFVGDVAFYYGDRAPNFVSPKHLRDGLGFGFDYDVVNSEVILEKMSVRDGRIYLPHGQSYAVLVLPDQDRARPEVLAKIEEMVQAGATIVGRKPSRSYRLHEAIARDAQVQEIAGRLWGEVDSVQVQQGRYGQGQVFWGLPLREVLARLGIGPDVQVAASLPPEQFDFIHRQTETAELYFLRNRSEQATQATVTFRVKGKVPRLYDARSGEPVALPAWQETEAGTQVPLFFEGLDAVAVVFEGEKSAAAFSEISYEGKPLFPAEAAPVPLHLSEASLVLTKNGRYEFAGKKGSQTVTVDLPAPRELTGPWEVRFPHGWRAPARAEFPALISWHESPDEGIRHFSGTATYYQAFTLAEEELGESQQLWLDLGEVKEIAEVWVNGHALGIRWHAPYRYDLTGLVKPGENQLVIEVVNTLNNRLVGDHQLPEAYRRTKSNITKLPNAWMTPMAEAELLPSGLLGPVRLQWGQVVGK